MADFRFNPHRVRKAGLPSVAHARALRAVWDTPRAPQAMHRIFGRDVTDELERAGYIAVSPTDGRYYITMNGLTMLTRYEQGAWVVLDERTGEVLERKPRRTRQERRHGHDAADDDPLNAPVPDWLAKMGD